MSGAPRPTIRRASAVVAFARRRVSRLGVAAIVTAATLAVTATGVGPVAAVRADAPNLSTIRHEAAAATTPLDTPRPPAPGEQRFIVRTDGTASLDRLSARLPDVGVAQVHRLQHALTALVVQGTPERVAALARVPGVIAVEPASPVRMATTQRDVVNWGLDRVDQRPRFDATVSSSYTYTNDGAGVTVYVLDTGVRSSHVQFGGRVDTSKSYYYPFAGDPASAEDCQGHGTKVASVVGGSLDGVAKGVRLVSVKVLDCQGNGENYTVAAGIDWIVNDHLAGRPAVANMSMAGSASSALDAAVAAMVADGITVVVASGNQYGNSCDFSPGRTPSVITVGSIDDTDTGSTFSNAGPCTDILAPGDRIHTANIWAGGLLSDTASAISWGTSFAAPHVAGAAALVLQRSPLLSPAQVWASLDASSTKGVVTERVGDPDKVLYVEQFLAVAPWADGLNLFDAPLRLVDTRSGRRGALEANDEVNRFAAGEVRRYSMAGLPARSAVVLNIAAVNPERAGHIRVYPCSSTSTAVPTVSYMNFRAGANLANEGVIGVGDAGGICVYAFSPLHLVIDAVGWIPAGATHTALAPPVRLVDTRPSTTGANYRGVLELTVDEALPFAAGEVRRYVPLGAGSIPASGVRALTLNVVAVAPTTGGELRLYPCDSASDVPTGASTVTAYSAGVTVATGAVASLSASGGFCVQSSGSAHLVVDVTGRFGATGALRSMPDAGYPVRLLDTRVGLMGALESAESTDVVDPLLGNVSGAYVLRFTGVGGIADAPGVQALVVSITARDAVARGHLLVWACDAASDPAPVTSAMNFNPGVAVSNLVVMPVSAAGSVCLRASSDVHVTIDVSSWFAAVPL